MGDQRTAVIFIFKVKKHVFVQVSSVRENVQASISTAKHFLAPLHFLNRYFWPSPLISIMVEHR